MAQGSFECWNVLYLPLRWFCDCVHLATRSGASDGKESACNPRDLDSTPGLEDPLEEGMATHSSYSCLENSMDRGAWQATVHGVLKSQT